MLDAEAVRGDFPVLSREVNGYPLAYLDNGATTQVPRAVLDCVQEHYCNHNANVHRGMHALANESTAALEAARRRVARYVGAEEDECVVFTRGTTDSINMAALGLRHLLGPGDAVVTTVLEHHSNFVPWQQACAATGAEFIVVGMDERGDVDLGQLERALSGPARVRVVACTCCSNVLGTATPARRIVELAHAAGALCLLDGAQAMRHGLGRLDETGADFLALSGHKMCAGTGIGVLAGRRAAMEELAPSAFGGEMVDEVSIERTTWADLPLRLEAGTPNYVGAIALGAACDYLEGVGRADIAAREDELVAHACEKLSRIEGLHVYGNPVKRCGCVSFNVDGVHPLDLCTMVDTRGIALRSGHNCAQPLLHELGVKSVARLSPAFYNTFEEIDRAAECIERVSVMLRRAGER